MSKRKSSAVRDLLYKHVVGGSVDHRTRNTVCDWWEELSPSADITIDLISNLVDYIQLLKESDE